MTRRLICLLVVGCMALWTAGCSKKSVTSDGRTSSAGRAPVEEPLPNLSLDDPAGTERLNSGMAMAKNAPNKDNALKLMEFLSDGTAQKIYAEQVYEYPVLPGAEPSEVVKSFGTLKPDPLPLIDIAANRKKASELVDKVGYNDGPSQ